MVPALVVVVVAVVDVDDMIVRDGQLSSSRDREVTGPSEAQIFDASDEDAPMNQFDRAEKRIRTFTDRINQSQRPKHAQTTISFKDDKGRRENENKNKIYIFQTEEEVPEAGTAHSEVDADYAEMKAADANESFEKYYRIKIDKYTQQQQ